MNNVAGNLRFSNKDLKLFEIGYVFYPKKDDVPEEVLKLAMIASGKLQEQSWKGDKDSADFFYLKGAIDAVCKGLNATPPLLKLEDNPFFENGRSAGIYFGEEKAGFIGEVSSEIAESFDVEESVFFLEVDYEPLITLANTLPEYKPLSKYPGITLDVAILVDNSVTNHRVLQVVSEAGEELLKSVKLFDLYSGKNIPSGKKSMAYSLFYQAFDRTLTTEEAVALHDKVKKALIDELDSEIR